ncbi:hypothetical protein BTO01_28040 [Vibrio jasicida]|uniref:Ig-like domain-containing protein n=1 Tax=Vibrio jasicida TaxID=766224 RepID=UPI000CF561B8|nr:Ig-like domain-containing protein [Vibrio jasicida]PQJ49051.1 hypothetical protein BTO01_28040 [Vibrio jasicida]
MMKIKPSLWALMLTTLTLLGCNNGDEGLTGSVPELPESVSELVVTPKNESLPVGLEWPFKAEAVLNNGEVKNVTTREEITWSSSDDSIASVDTNGIVTAKEGGTVTITASGRSEGTDFIDTAELTVTEAIVTKLVIEPKESDVAIGLPIQYTATAYFSDDTSLNVTTNKNVTWASTSEEVATISNAPEDKGEAKGITEGVTTITATGTLNGVTFDDSTTLTVTGATVTELTISAEEDSIPVGLTTQFTAIATLSNGQNIDVTDFDEITWTSEDASIATIDNETSPENETVKGRATGINASSSPVHIFARGNVNGVGFEASEPLLVSEAIVTKIVVSSESTSIPEGLTEQFKAEAHFSDEREPVDVTEHPDVTWTSSNTNVATVDNATDIQSGRVKGLARGVEASDEEVIIKASGNIDGEKIEGQSQLTVIESVFPITWGHPEYGGDSSNVQSDLFDIVSISNTDFAFAALKNNKTVVTWGRPEFGGDSSTVQSDLLDVKSIFSNEEAFAALKSDGSVITWGVPESGGDSSSVQNVLVDIKTIFSNPRAFAALKNDGTVITWGDDTDGGDSSGVQTFLTNVKEIFHNRVAFAALKNDGTVITWGRDSGGGNSSEVADELQDVVEVTGTSEAFAALKSDGTVVTWGDDMSGGDSSTVTGDLHDVTKITASISSFAALKNDGSVVTWGAPITGGNSANVQGELNRVTKIFSSVDSVAFAALREDGRVITWGVPSLGGSSQNVESELINVVNVFVGTSAFSALREDGAVISWGDESLGGDNSNVEDQLTDIKRVFNNNVAFCALRY